MANLLPACDPPLITLNAGTGNIMLEFPANSAKCLYSGMPFLAAPALATAKETPESQILL